MSEMDCSGGQVLDRQALDKLRMLQRPGRPNLVLRVIDLYLTETPALLTELETAIQAGDPDTMQKAAHALKSTTANVGGKTLTPLFKELEMLGREDSIEGAAGILEQATSEFERVQHELRAERDRVAA